MKHEAFVRAEAGAGALGLVLVPTAFADLGDSPNVSEAAFAGAETYPPESRTPGIELDAAIVAGGRTAGIAERGPGGARNILFAAVGARDKANRATVSSPGEAGIFAPEGDIRRDVARGTKGNKVFEPVGFDGLGEQVERAAMVNREARSGVAAYLARIPVALSRRLSLSLPARASVLRMTAQPSGVVGTAPVWRRTPKAEATPGAKVVRGDSVGLLLEGNPASVAIDRNPLTYAHIVHYSMSGLLKTGVA